MRSATAASVLLAAVGLTACGGSGAGVAPKDAGADAAPEAGSDAGADAASDAESNAPDPTRWRSFDVTAALTLAPPADDPGSWATFPRTAVFTLVWDVPGNGAVSGANGVFGGGHVEATDGGSSLSVPKLAASVPFPDGCGATGTITFDDVTFSVTGSALTGTGTGRASYITSGAETIEAPFSATLTGVPDATPPVLTLATAWSSPDWTDLLTTTSSVSTTDFDPLQPLIVRTSEPLPVDTAASLMNAASTDIAGLDGLVIDPVAWAAAGYQLASQPFGYGQTYTVSHGPFDFAGHAPAPFTFSTRATPPLVPADGFESVTGTMFAGAGVLRGGPLMPISGQTSLMLNTGFGGGFGFLPYDLGPSFAVRLAAGPPGAHVVRFSYQLIAPDSVDSAAFDGVVRAGWPGVAVVESRDLGATQFTRTTLPSLGDIFLSPVRAVELSLPAGLGSEIAFEIVGRTFACKRPPSPTVLVIDDLRVE